MFELPEYITLARQMNETLTGRVIQQGMLGNSPHKFVWYNRSHEEFEQLTRGKRIGEASVRGRWLTLDLDPGYRLLLGECGGKVLYHTIGSVLPGKFHLLLKFEDGSSLTILTSMWGAMELYEKGQELERKYIKGMRTTPVDPEFTYDYFSSLLEQLVAGENRSVKSLLTQDQLIPGLGNAIAQDILFAARLHPRHPLVDLSSSQRKTLYKAIVDTVGEVISKNGRCDETDLHGIPGGYARIMDSHATGQPCPRCGSRVEKIQYLGGSCYLCTNCQVLPSRA
jgi:formamidopyrimidine-DNA glycosylase